MASDPIGDVIAPPAPEEPERDETLVTAALANGMLQSAAEQALDPNFGMPVINQTDVPAADVFGEMDPASRKIVAAFTGWAQSTQSNPRARQGGLWSRDRYLAPRKVIEQMRVAYSAVETDDIVSGVAETTEALAFSLVSFVADDEDDQDVYNQIAADIDLDDFLRQWWRELFTVSQVTIAVWWDDKTYKPRGKTDAGNARRKEYKDIRVPIELTILDPLRVVPVGTTMFGKERLAYQATRSESLRFADILSLQTQTQDEIVERLLIRDPRSNDGRYVPDRSEEQEISAAGFDPKNLWLLDPNNVFRHTLTRIRGYQRWAPVRMRSVFELLDLKQQLHQMERAHLIGATNFIVLITKGSDDLPAQQAEVDALQAHVRTVASVPILVGDHRLKVEIITPKLDNTLRAEKFNTIDSRLTARLYQMFQLGNYAAGASGDDSAKLMKVVAKGMESRRHMMRRSFEAHVLKPLFDMNDALTTPPKLLYHPRAIALDFDSAWASFLLQLRQDREISRDTILTQFDLDQKHEFLMLTREDEKYDETFQSKVAFSGPGDPKGPFDPTTGLDKNGRPATPGAAPPAADPSRSRDNGGGARNGGGAAPGTGQGQPPRNPTKRSDKGRKKPAIAALDSDPDAGVTITITNEDGDVIAEGTPLDGVDVTALLQETSP